MEETKEIVICDNCKGTGESIKYSWDDLRPIMKPEKCQCPTCDGTGRLRKVVTYEKLQKQKEICTACIGNGWIPDGHGGHRCPNCKGQGLV